jgi:glycosyltransferase involved in cell wall biosynthesis
MRIVIDGRMWSWTGIGRITRSLLVELEQLDQKNEYIVLMLAKDFDKWVPTKPNFTKVLANYAPYSLAEQTGLALKLYQLKPDLVHFLNFNLPVAYFGRYVVIINDLTLIHYKNVRGAGLAKLLYECKYWAMRLVFRHAVMVSSHIITISKYVKDELITTYQNDMIRKISAKKITVAYPAVDRELSEPTTVNHIVSGPFLLSVGNSYPHKNVRSLIDAFELLQAKRNDLSLVLVGANDYFSRQLQSYAKNNPKVIFPGYVSDKELAGLYKSAALFVCPSLSEGFGLTPLEAMLHGAPVISSDSSCLPEVCEDGAAYFDATSPAKMAEAILELLGNKAELERLKKAGPAQAKKFSWKKMAKDTLDVYDKILARISSS